MKESSSTVRSAADDRRYEGQQIPDGRELQAALLQRSASRIHSCWDGSLNDALSHALDRNRTIWAAFQRELLDPDTSVPPAIRLNLLKFSRVVNRVTFEIRAEPAAEKLQILIDINTGIAEGLLGLSGDARAA